MEQSITKNKKLQIYQTIVQSILTYGAEVWQISTREIKRILSTEMDVLRSVGKSRMDQIRNKKNKGNNGSARETRHIKEEEEEKKDYSGMAMSKECQSRD